MRSNVHSMTRYANCQLRITRPGWSFTPTLAAVACGVLAACAEPAANQRPIVTAEATIPPGADCAFGGVRLSSGPDDNDNGVLDPVEVEQTTDVCKPAPPPGEPPPTLVRRDVEPPGPSCFRGGTAVHSGPDLDRNGTLDDAEIVATSFVCTVSDIFEGDFTPAMWSDPAAVTALGQARVVTGRLAIAGEAPVSLPALELVGGSVVLSRAGTPARFEATALAHIGGNLVVDGPGFTGDLVLPALVRVGGDLTLGDATLPGFRAPRLASVGGSLIAHGAALAALELPALRTAGSVAVTELPVTALELPAMTTVLGGLRLGRLPALTLLDLPALRSVGDQLVLTELPALRAIDLALLGQVRDVFLGAVAARTLRLPALSVVEGHLWITDSVALERLTLPALNTVGRALIVARCPGFQSLAAPVLDSVGEQGGVNGLAILLDAVDLEALSLPRLRSAPDGVRVASTSLSALELPALVRTSLVQLEDNAYLTTVALPALVAIDHAIIDAPALRELSLTALETATRRLEIRNTQLANLRGLGRLHAIGLQPGADLVIDGNAALTSLAGLERLTAITGKLTLTSNAKLASLAGLAALETVGGAVTVTGDPALSPDEIAALIARVHP